MTVFNSYADLHLEVTEIDAGVDHDWVYATDGDVYLELPGDADIDVTVDLDIGAGVTVYFTGDFSLIIDDGVTIDADGATFTSDAVIPEAGDWGSIELSGAIGNYATGEFTNCIFEYGGDEDGGNDHPHGPISITNQNYGDVSVDNCELRHCLGTAIGSSDGSHDSRISVTNCLIWHCENGITLRVLEDLDEDYYHEIRNNILVGFDEFGENVEQYGYGIWIDQEAPDVWIENNIIAECANDGIRCMTLEYIVNNTIANVGGSGIYFTDNDEDYVFDPNADVRNNIIYAFGGDAGIHKDEEIDPFTVNYNYVYDTSNPSYSQGVTGTNHRPEAAPYLPIFALDKWSSTFPDPNDIDYHLAFYSECVHNGDPAIENENTTDSDLGGYGGGDADPYFLAITGSIVDQLTIDADQMDDDLCDYHLVGTCDISPTGGLTIEPDGEDLTIYAHD